MEKAFFLSLSAALFAVALGYGSGPPVDADPNLCSTMFPSGHEAVASSDPLPFEYQLGSTCYKAGMEVQVSVSLKAGMTTYFEGLFVQARKADVMDEAFGMFDTKNSDELKTLDCFNMDNSKNALSQSSKAHYICQNFSWTAPDDLRDEISFQMTIVRETEEFWMNVMSATLTYDANCMATGTAPSCPDGTKENDETDDDSRSSEDDDEDDDEDNDEDTNAAGQFTGSVTLSLLALAVLAVMSRIARIY